MKERERLNDEALGMISGGTGEAGGYYVDVEPGTPLRSEPFNQDSYIRRYINDGSVFTKGMTEIDTMTGSGFCFLYVRTNDGEWGWIQQ